jgi:hypothetical protein
VLRAQELDDRIESPPVLPEELMAPSKNSSAAPGIRDAIRSLFSGGAMPS